MYDYNQNIILIFAMKYQAKDDEQRFPHAYAFINRQ